MSAAAIITYLEANPAGAHPAAIAEHVGSQVNVVCVQLGRLQDRNLVTRHGIGRSRLNATWRIVGAEPPRTFGGEETLAAMQAACRARLMAQPALMREAA